MNKTFIMATTLKTEVNYFIIKKSGEKEKPFPKKSLYYDILKEVLYFYIGKSPAGDPNGYPIKLTGTVNLDSGASGSVDGISVNGVEIMSPAKATATLVSLLTNVFATNTAQCTSVIAGNTVVLNALTYTAVDGVKTDFTEFSADGTDDDVAADLKDSIENDARAGTTGDVSATVSTDTVTMTTDVLGTGGNAITLTETGGTITLGGATFSGGVNADKLTANALEYTAVVGVPANFTEFSTDVDDNAAAASLVAAINGDSRAGTLNDLTAAAVTNVVTMTQTVSGAEGKDTTLVENTSGARITISGATFDAPVAFDTDLSTTATNTAANISGFVTDYSAIAVGALITIMNEKTGRIVDAFDVTTEVTTIAATDVDMGFETGGLINGSGDEFGGIAALETVLRTDTAAP